MQTAFIMLYALGLCTVSLIVCAQDRELLERFSITRLSSHVIKTFYLIVGRLELVSYHLVFFYSHILKEFNRDLPAFLIGQVSHGCVFLHVQLFKMLHFLSVQIMIYLVKVMHSSQCFQTYAVLEYYSGLFHSVLSNSESSKPAMSSFGIMCKAIGHSIRNRFLL